MVPPAIRDNQESLRERYPSGWLALTKHESIPRIVEALLDRPAHREFNQSELAAAAALSRQSVIRHLDLLLAGGILEPVENTTPQRYRFGPENDVSRAIIRLDGAMDAAGPKASVAANRSASRSSFSPACAISSGQHAVRSPHRFPASRP